MNFLIVAFITFMAIFSIAVNPEPDNVTLVVIVAFLSLAMVWVHYEEENK